MNQHPEGPVTPQKDRWLLTNGWVRQIFVEEATGQKWWCDSDGALRKWTKLD